MCFIVWGIFGNISPVTYLKHLYQKESLFAGKLPLQHLTLNSGSLKKAAKNNLRLKICKHIFTFLRHSYKQSILQNVILGRIANLLRISCQMRDTDRKWSENLLWPKPWLRCVCLFLSCSRTNIGNAMEIPAGKRHLWLMFFFAPRGNYPPKCCWNQPLNRT